MTVDPNPIIRNWPEETRESAELVIDNYGEPDEATESMLIWHQRGPWRKTIAYRDAVDHNFPKPHRDSVEQFIDYRVPVNNFNDLAAFDGSVVAERTAGILSARCHDEEANRLAINLVDDIVAGDKSVAEARDYYAYEFLAYRKKEPTPYMDELRVRPQSGAGDPDERLLSDDQLQRAVEEGEAKG